MRRELLLLPLLAAIVAAIPTPAGNSTDTSRHWRYRGTGLYTVWADNDQQLEQREKISHAVQADQWEHGGGAGGSPALWSVQPQLRAELELQLQQAGLRYRLDVDDLAARLEREDETLRAWTARSSRNIYEQFPRYDEVVTYLQELTARHPTRAELRSAGTSTQGRDLPYVLVHGGEDVPPRPLIIVMAGLHAREWITVPTALYALHRLLDDPAPDAPPLDWLVIPIINPDGVEWTHTDDRMWRRTRSDTGHETCVGVDGNRNFDVNFNTDGVSQDRCSDVYPGAEAFSEPETRAMRDLLADYGERTVMFLDIHAHGNYVLYERGDGSLPSSPHLAHLHAVGAAMGAVMDSLKLPEAGLYLVGNSALMLYPTSGTSQDYAAHVGIPLSYTYELPGLGLGFLLPVEHVGHVTEETWAGIEVGARLAYILYGSTPTEPNDQTILKYNN